MRRTALAGMTILTVLMAACGGGDGERGSDPFGLSSLPMPATEAEITAVLEAMPSQVAGVPRNPASVSPFVRRYGDRSSLLALPFPPEGSDPTETLAEDLAQFETEAGAVVEDRRLDAGAGLVWIRGSFTDGNGTVYLMVWGEPGSGWAFNASAESPEVRDALVRAFVAAAGG